MFKKSLASFCILFALPTAHAGKISRLHHGYKQPSLVKSVSPVQANNPLPVPTGRAAHVEGSLGSLPSYPLGAQVYQEAHAP